MTTDHNKAPYFTLVKEASKIQDAIDHYKDWDESKFCIGDKSYTLLDHFKYLNAKYLAYTNAMELLTQHGMGPKT